MNHLFICFSAVQMYDHSCIHLKNQYVIYLKEFHGQGINDTVDRQKFQVAVSARYIRFHPIQQQGWNCLRVEAYIIESKSSAFFHFFHHDDSAAIFSKSILAVRVRK